MARPKPSERRRPTFRKPPPLETLFSPFLPVSPRFSPVSFPPVPRFSPFLTVSPRFSPLLPASPRFSPLLPASPRCLPVSPPVSPRFSPFFICFRPDLPCPTGRSIGRRLSDGFGCAAKALPCKHSVFRCILRFACVPRIRVGYRGPKGGLGGFAARLMQCGGSRGGDRGALGGSAAWGVSHARLSLHSREPLIQVRGSAPRGARKQERAGKGGRELPPPRQITSTAPNLA